MSYQIEPGRVVHLNDANEVDSEIEFRPPEGERAFEIISAYFTPGTNTQKIQNDMMQLVMDSMRDQLWAVVETVLGKPYHLQGNRLDTGFDIAGLIQYVYNHIYGVSFPLDLKTQLDRVQHVSLAEAMPGDLLFWGTPALITNAGVYLGHAEYLTVDLMAQVVLIQKVAPSWQPDVVGSLR
ncbi:hypothetical protein JOC36_000191 [Weissella uvarum]|uniref:C40 family peptidase n=1 Tax=Weissella uvarum TaxID=1479233 RepID=UPI00195FF851|nr:NlpC/P60 family protein [Weissella uvarum]MBM7616658.1 hypothetical protein [Weissella uvarum]MCM0594884.1 C40 family peptidase [Weissella uvarum]